MEEPVLGDGLCKLLRVFEDFGPSFDGSDVGVHALAAGDGVWEEPEDVAK